MLLDALKIGAEHCAAFEFSFPRSNGEEFVRRALLGPIGHVVEDAERASDTEHPFCPCCMLTNSYGAFESLVEGDGFFAIRLLAMRNGDDDWEANIVAAFHALSLQVERQSKMSGKAETADLFAMEERHHHFHRALIAPCGSPRLLELAEQLYVETQRYRLPNYFGGTLGKRRRDAAAEHREIMDATLRRSEEAVRLLAEHYRKTAAIIEASIEWPAPPRKAAK